MLASTISDPLLGGVAGIMRPALPDLATIKRGTPDSGDMGGTSYAFTQTVATAIPCNLQNVTPRESEEFGRRGLIVSNKVFTSTNVSTRIGDRLYIHSDPTTFYNVVFISDMGGMHAAFKIYVNRVI